METNQILGLVVGQHYSDRAFDTMMNSGSGETICAFLKPCGGGGMWAGSRGRDKRWREEGKGGRHERKEEREGEGVQRGTKPKFAHFIHHLLA